VLLEPADLISPEDFTAALADIKQDATRLQEIVENLLALARIDRGSTVHKEPLFVRRIAARAVRGILEEVPERHIVLNFPETPVFVDGNALYLEQVFRNLLTNAIRYSAPDTTIDIEAVKTPGTMEVSVLDRGVGISPAEADALFRPFYRSSRTANVQGIGVGLALCKRLVEFQGGRISATPREGGGACFTISLPLSEVE
jgi:two-component system sensor histidine kinase KdpD